ncbi:MAG: hypothetical protein GX081_07295 [Firmicutes bacterium]|nr:hypothetical protein [Bacillota bacterium]
MLQIIRDPDLYRNPVGFMENYAGDEWREAGGKKPVFLFPTQTLLEYWEEQLLPAFGSWGGARFLLIDALVRDILEETRTGLAELTSGGSVLLLRLVADALARKGKTPYLAQASPTPGFYEALRREILLLKRAALEPSAFLNLVQSASPPLQELALVYAEYQQTLKRQHLADTEEKLRLATMEIVNASCWQKIGHLWVIGFTDFTPQQENFFHQISQLVKVTIVFDHSGAGRQGLPLPTWRRGALKEEVAGLHPPKKTETRTTLAYLQGALWAKEPAPAPVRADASIKLSTVKGGYRWELAALARTLQRLLAADPGLTPDQIGVVTPYPLDQVYQILSAAGLPLSAQMSTPLLEEPSAQALLQPFRVILSDFEWGEMTKFLRWGGLILEPQLYQLEPAASLPEWQAKLTNLYAADEEKKKLCQTLVDFLTQIPAQGSYAQYFQLGLAWLNQPYLLRNFLPQPKAAEPALHARFFQTSLLGRLRILLQKNLTLTAALAPQEVKLEDFYFTLEAILARELCPRPTSWVNGIRLLTPAEARGVNFRITCIVGLNEGLFPHLTAERWLLREETTQNWPLANVFPTNLQQLSRERLLFYYMIKTAREKLILSCCRTDEEGRPVNPCSFWHDVERLLPPGCVSQEEPEGQRMQLLLPPKPPVGINTKKTRHSWEEIRNEISQKIQAEEVRRRAGRSRNGFLGPGEAQLIQAKLGEAPISISALEEYATCPFAYFCRRWLRLKPLTVPEPVPSRLEEGSIAHGILNQFFKRHRGKVLSRNHFHEYANEIAALVERLYPAAPASPNQVQQNLLALGRENLTAILTRVIKEEISWQEQTGGRFTPRYLELGFGGMQKEADGASTPDPLTLETEDPSPDRPLLRLWGKIDRVDTASAGNFIVYDYKSGTPPTKTGIMKGKDLQLPLYLLAVSRLFLPAGHPVGASYYSLRQTHRLGGIWRQEALDFGVKVKGACTEEEWVKVLDNAVQSAVGLFDGIRRGHFPFAPPGECPSYCEFRTVCRQQIWGREGETHAE